MRHVAAAAVRICIAWLCALGVAHAEPVACLSSIAAFDAHVRAFRNWLEIPGLAAVIVCDGRIVWRANLGFADIAHNIPVTDATRFWIASLTKPMSATLLVQLADAGRVKLDEPLAKYAPGTDLSDNVLVAHVLSHTSTGAPGEVFAYSSRRFKLLTGAIEQAAGVPFADALRDKIFVPLHMTQTLANLAQANGEPITSLARPYTLGRKGNCSSPFPPPGINAAAGVISTANDLAKFAAALDGEGFVTAGEREQMFTARVGADGKALPYGLGWFSENHAGEAIVWHYGQGRGYASLMLKLPARKLTLIALSNAETMNAAFPLVDGEVANSSLAVDFLRDVARAGADARDADGQTLEQDAAKARIEGERYLSAATRRRKAR